jgi:GTP-binding protein
LDSNAFLQPIILLFISIQVEQEREEQKGKIATLKSASVDPKIKKQLETLKLGKIRLPRQSREEYGTQRDLSGAGEIGTTPSTAYFPPSQCRLLAQASQAERFPLETAPEVCFAGRSNVGKSSLLNALIGAPLSKTSSKPGQTTNIRWYSNSNLISLVDLPGYGFSFATNAKSETWMGAVKEYLSNRKALKRCFVLLDARHPLKRIDESTMKFLEECKTTYQIVLTKADLVSVDDLAKRIQQTQVDLKRFPRAISDVLVVSAKNRSGLAPLRRQMISLFDPEMKRAFEAERDKKYLAAQRRREKRALKDEKTQQDKLMEQKRHSMRALAAHVRNQRRASL